MENKQVEDAIKYGYQSGQEAIISYIIDNISKTTNYKDWYYELKQEGNEDREIKDYIKDLYEKVQDMTIETNVLNGLVNRDGKKILDLEKDNRKLERANKKLEKEKVKLQKEVEKLKKYILEITTLEIDTQIAIEKDELENQTNC